MFRKIDLSEHGLWKVRRYTEIELFRPIAYILFAGGVVALIVYLITGAGKAAICSMSCPVAGLMFLSPAISNRLTIQRARKYVRSVSKFGAKATCGKGQKNILSYCMAVVLLEEEKLPEEKQAHGPFNDGLSFYYGHVPNMYDAVRKGMDPKEFRKKRSKEIVYDVLANAVLLHDEYNRCSSCEKELLEGIGAFCDELRAELLAEMEN